MFLQPQDQPDSAWDTHENLNHSTLCNYFKLQGVDVQRPVSIKELLIRKEIRADIFCRKAEAVSVQQEEK